jgi:hypothetical protein
MSNKRTVQLLIANSTGCPHPKSLSQSGRGTLNPAPLRPFWEKGLGDEGKLAKLGCTQSTLAICGLIQRMIPIN